MDLAFSTGAQQLSFSNYDFGVNNQNAALFQTICIRKMVFIFRTKAGSSDIYNLLLHVFFDQIKIINYIYNHISI